MTRRTTQILFVIALGLFAFIALFERKTISTGELEGREGRVLERFVRDRVDRLVLVRDGATVEIRRERSGRDGEPDTYRLVRPVEAAADDEVVGNLLGSLEWAEPVRTLEDVSEGDLRRFGLDRPRLRVTVGMGSESVELRIGQDDATGEGVYARGEDPAVVYVVGRDLVEALDHEPGHFRSKKLFPEAGDAMTAFRLVTPGGTVQMRRDGEDWMLVAPLAMRGSAGRAASVAAVVRDLAATRFVEDRPGDLARYGLATPALSLEAGTSSEPRKHRLAVGGFCGDHAGERYARAGDGPVVCVSQESITALEAHPDAYRETRSVTVDDSEVKALVLTDGRATLEVEDHQGTWKYELRGAGAPREGTVDAEALSEWLDALRHVRATSVSTAAPPAFATTLTIHRTDERPDEVLRLAAPSGETMLGQRNGESVVLAFPAQDADAFAVSLVHLRSRSLVDEPESGLASVEVDRGGVREVLRRGSDGALAVVEPVAMPADAAEIGDVTLRLARLEAVRFVADEARPEHGLASPRIRVRFRFEGAPDDDGHGHAPAGATPPPREHELLIGAAGEQGAYARLDADPAVFLLPDATVRLFESPLASKSELRTDSLYLDALEVVNEAGNFQLRRDGTTYYLGGDRLPEDRGTPLFEGIADLEADRVVGYGAPPAASGLAAPRARITVTRSAEAPAPQRYVIALGATTGTGDEARVYVRREDLAVTYLVPERFVQRYFDFRP